VVNRLLELYSSFNFSPKLREKYMPFYERDKNVAYSRILVGQAEPNLFFSVSKKGREKYDKGE
jgi:hypothetical protein